MWIKKKCWPKKNVGQKKFWVKKMWLKKKCGYFFLHESSSWVKIGLHAENQLPGWSGTGLKVFRWWWVGGLHTHNRVKPTLLVKVELGFDNNQVNSSVSQHNMPQLQGTKQARQSVCCA